MSMKRIFCISFLALTASGVVSLIACSSDDTSTSSSSSSSGSSGQTGETVTVHVSAANGGTVADKDGKASLAIPPGALDKDTDITLKITAKSGTALVDIADYGPDGLKFLKPATITMKADASLATNGKTLAVATGTGGNFTAIAGSTYANGVATAPVEHFTQFTIVLVDGKPTLVLPSTCTDARANFTACGGDPTGTWLFADFCPDPATTKVPDPFNGKCAGFVGYVEYTNSEEITIDATTVTSSAGTVNINFKSDYPVQCLSDVSDGGLTMCSQGGGNGSTCTDTGGGNCHCEYPNSSQQAAKAPETYTTNGSTWTSASGDTGKYCVSGDILYYLGDPKDGGTSNLLYVLKRK